MLFFCLADSQLHIYNVRLIFSPFFTNVSSVLFFSIILGSVWTRRDIRSVSSIGMMIDFCISVENMRICMRWVSGAITAAAGLAEALAFWCGKQVLRDRCLITAAQQVTVCPANTHTHNTHLVMHRPQGRPSKEMTSPASLNDCLPVILSREMNSSEMQNV